MLWSAEYQEIYIKIKILTVWAPKSKLYFLRYWVLLKAVKLLCDIKWYNEFDRAVLCTFMFYAFSLLSTLHLENSHHLKHTKRVNQTKRCCSVCKWVTIRYLHRFLEKLNIIFKAHIWFGNRCPLYWTFSDLWEIHKGNWLPDVQHLWEIREI